MNTQDDLHVDSIPSVTEILPPFEVTADTPTTVNFPSPKPPSTVHKTFSVLPLFSLFLGILALALLYFQSFRPYGQWAAGGLIAAGIASLAIAWAKPKPKRVFSVLVGVLDLLLHFTGVGWLLLSGAPNTTTGISYIFWGLGILGGVLSLIFLLVALVKKKPKSRPVFFLLFSLVLGGIGFSLIGIDFLLGRYVLYGAIILFILLIFLFSVLGKHTKKSTRITFLLPISTLLVVLFAAAGTLQGYAIIQYSRAQAYEARNPAQASAVYQSLGKFKDAPSKAVYFRNKAAYLEAEKLLDAKDYVKAKGAFDALVNFEDAADQALFCEDSILYGEAQTLMAAEKYSEAYDAFLSVSDGFQDSAEKARVCKQNADYQRAEEKLKAKDYETAYALFTALDDFKDSREKAKQCVFDFPKTGVIERNSKFGRGSPYIKFIIKEDIPTLIKIFTDKNEFVAFLFIAKKGSTRINLPAGKYYVNNAYGYQWFGNKQMFGVNAEYYKADDTITLTSTKRSYTYYEYVFYDGSPASKYKEAPSTSVAPDEF